MPVQFRTVPLAGTSRISGVFWKDQPRSRTLTNTHIHTLHTRARAHARMQGHHRCALSTGGADSPDGQRQNLNEEIRRQETTQLTDGARFGRSTMARDFSAHTDGGYHSNARPIKLAARSGREAHVELIRHSVQIKCLDRRQTSRGTCSVSALNNRKLQLHTPNRSSAVSTCASEHGVWHNIYWSRQSGATSGNS